MVLLTKRVQLVRALSRARPSIRIDRTLCVPLNPTYFISPFQENMFPANRGYQTFSEVPAAPADPMFILKQSYEADTSPTKIDLGAGVLRDEQGNCHEFAVIKEAKGILANLGLDHDYRPTTGIPSFRRNAARLMFGEENKAYQKNRIATVQTVAGTGACRIGATFLRKHWPLTLKSGHDHQTSVYIGIPTWGNYEPLFRHAEFRDQIFTYPYLDAAQNVDMDSVIRTLQNAPDNSIFVFQGCCHNPTGRDYSQKQWTHIAQLMQKKKHFAFFDTAYQGLGQGVAEDAWAIQHFASQGVDMLVAQSFSKNAGLYSERVGALHVICSTPQIATNVVDQLRSLTRWEVSSAPAFGAQLVDIILSDRNMEKQWKIELQQTRQRIRSLREGLHHELTARRGTPSPRTGTAQGWDHILGENGLFSYTGLSPSQTRELIAKYHLYMPGNGRINVSGLTTSNISRVAEAFDDVIRGEHA